MACTTSVGSRAPLQRALAGRVQMRGRSRMLALSCRASGAIPPQTSRKVTNVFTASRAGEDCLRIAGEGSSGPQVGQLGRVLGVDEFFSAPRKGLDGGGGGEAGWVQESLVYYMDEIEEGEAGEITGHGIQVHLNSNMTFLSGPPGGGIPPISHMREPNQVAEARLGDALVKVVAGGCGPAHAPPPLDGFTVLDVEMRPGTEAYIPIPSGEGAVIFVVEGVGLFGDQREEEQSVAYQNEGHCLWLGPPEDGEGGAGDAMGDPLRVRTHRWSELRFILVSGGAFAT